LRAARTCLIFGLIAAAAKPALAEAPAAAPEPADSQEVVVTGTRTPESTQRATVRTEVVTREEAERRGARNVGEALAGEPSLQVNPQAYGFLGGPSGVQMQGLDGDRVLILEDGERVIGDVGGVIDLSELPLTAVDRIEYVVGPSSSLYGSNALGGVINIVTAPPRSEGPSGRGRFEGRTTGDALAEAATAYRRENTWASVEGSFGYQHPHELDAGPELLVPSGTQTLLGLRAGFRPARRIELRFKARYVHDRNDGVTTEDIPGLRTFVIDLPERNDRLNLRANEALDLGKGSRLSFSLGQSFYRGRSGRDRRDSPVDEERRRDGSLSSFEAVATLADGAQRTWVFGARTESERFSETVERVIPGNDGLETRTADEVAPTLLSSAALFGQLGYRISPLLTLMPGVRGELHDRYGAVAAPRLAVALAPSEAVSVRASGGRGFRAPSAKEYGFAFDHSVIGYRVLGNPELVPETSWGVSGDVTVRPSQLWRVRAGAFGNWVKNLISFEPAPVQTDPNVTDYYYVNVASARTFGGDASLRVDPIAGILRADAAYAYLFTRDDTTGEALPNRPPHTVTLSASARLSRKFEANARFRYVATTFVTSGLETPGYGLLDARVGYSPLPAVQFYVGGLNLLDVERDPELVGDARPTLGATLYAGVRGDLAFDDETAED
jgi:outer membrane receptor for ferrienterochelin and colicins